MPPLNRLACPMAQATNIATRKRAWRAPELTQILVEVEVEVEAEAGRGAGGGNLNSQISIRTKNRNH